MHVACAADAAYAPHLATMLHSLLSHTDAALVQIHVLHDDSLPERMRDPLAAMAQGLRSAITFHAMATADFADLPAMPRIPRLMWYRAHLPELLRSVDRVLYLDADTLVQDDIAPLWEVDLAGFHLAAVDNVLQRGFTDRAAQLGLAPGQNYFNSGVLLMNLEQMRRDRCAAAILGYGRTHGTRLVWPDQDALNVVLGQRRLSLHPRWNCQNTLYYFSGRSSAVFGRAAVSEAVRRPAVLHFEGPGLAKPWHYLCKHPLRARYWEHRRHTPWPAAELEGRNWTTRALKLVPMALLPNVYDALHRMKRAALRMVS